jgi:3',5'-nucleoside bisphosphate phosphatase
MQKYADLHTHTIFSDGKLTPEELLIKARDKGLYAISITDHDTVEGSLVGQSISDEYGVEVIVGCEFSSLGKFREYHILGYEFDYQHPEMQEFFSMIKESRLKRAESIHNKLGSLGINFDFDLILEKAKESPITRPHIASVLDDLKVVDNVRQAFYKYLRDGGPAFSQKDTYDYERIIKMINNAGGVAILAHPANSIDQATLYKMIKAGLDGIEVVHPMHNSDKTKYYQKIASQFWLLDTGGSDFHGRNDYEEENFGTFKVPYSKVESIRNYSKSK